MNKLFILFFTFIIFLLNKIIVLNANDDTYINSSNIVYDEKENIVELSENSKINFNNINVLIDRGIIDYNKNEFEVFGNFYLYEEFTILSGDNLKGTNNLDSFTANNVSYIYNDDLKIDSEKIDRKNKNIYFYDNFLTPCELDGFFDCPTWSLRIDKTEYEIEKDKFNHFDSFLQIADKKVFYLPYFSHYGSKAPRQKGFLTPTLEFTIGSGQSIKTPYYFPINKSSDIIITPKFSFDENFEFLDDYNLNTIYEKRSSGGNTLIELNSLKTKKSNNINSSLKVETKQIIDKEKIFSASGTFTNSVSTSRSINTESVTFDELYLKFENYDFYKKNDYLKAELTSIKSFDSSSISLIPISPIAKYHSTLLVNDYLFINDLNFTILKRDESSNIAASEGLKIDTSNTLNKNIHSKNFFVYNKLKFNLSYGDYTYNKNKELNSDSLKSKLTYSGDFYFNLSKKITPRLKFILPYEIVNTNKSVNEDSKSVTFNYHNLFSDSRVFGNDLVDNSPRVIMGVENDFYIKDTKIKFYINQSYDFKKNNNYSSIINQSSNFSDYNILLSSQYNNVEFKIDSRVDQNNFSKKEMNYSIKSQSPVYFNIDYNETQSEAFKDLSGNTKSLTLGLGNQINNNLSIFYNSKIDVLNKYSPFESSININIFDECSRLEIAYSNSRFNDNFNTTPSEIVSFRFYMDYLGFFGYEQTTDLLFKETGTLDYGL